MRQVITETEAGMLLRDYLRGTLRFSNRLVIQLKAAPNGLMVNGETKTVRYCLQEEDIIEINFPPEKVSPALKRENIPMDIIYEDEYLLVVNKQAGMPTIPSNLYPSGTLANAILGYYEIKKLPYTVHIVTRLDKDTSGLVLIAKHRHSHALFSTMQQQNKVHRKYLTFVQGIIRQDKATINLPIARKEDSIIERTVAENGQVAITHYRVLDQLKDISILEVTLETGRTHQIRVHFAHLGYPLVGDDLYGGTLLDAIKRQALHCSEISFIHPFTNETLLFSAPLPSDMKKIISEMTDKVDNS